MNGRIVHWLLAFCLFKVAMATAWTDKLGLSAGALVLWFLTGLLCGAVLMIALAVTWSDRSRP